MKSMQILEAQVAKYPHLKDILKAPFPCSTSDVTQPNFLFSKRIEPSFSSKNISQTEFEYSQLLDIKPTDHIIASEGDSTITKAELIVDTRGMGKTNYLMNLAISRHLPTVYIDLSSPFEPILKQTIDRIVDDAQSLSRTERTILAVVCLLFFLFFKNQCATQLLCAEMLQKTHNVQNFVLFNV